MCFQAQQHPKLTAIHFRRGEGVEEGGTQAWNPQNIKALKETAKNPLHRCLLALEKRLKTWAASGRSRRHRGHPGPCSCSHKTLPPHFFPKTAQPEHKALPRSSHLRAHLNQGDAAASCDQGLPPLQGAWGFLRPWLQHQHLPLLLVPEHFSWRAFVTRCHSLTPNLSDPLVTNLITPAHKLTDSC